MDKREVYRDGCAQGSDLDRGSKFLGQAGDGVHDRDQSHHHSGFSQRLRGSLHVTLEEGTWAPGCMTWSSRTSRNWWYVILAGMPCSKRVAKSDASMRGSWRVVAREPGAAGLSRGEWSTDAEGAGEELPGDQHGSDTSDEPREGDLIAAGGFPARASRSMHAPSFRVAR